MLPGNKPAFIVDIATLIPSALAARYWSPKEYQKKTPLDIAIAVYLFISIFSLLLYLQPDNLTSPKAYLYGIHHFVLPIFLFYAVKAVNPFHQNRLLFLVCYLNVFAVSLGILLFYARPNFYYKFLVEKALSSQGYLEYWQIFGRMQSYLSSTSIGMIAAITIVLFLFLNVHYRLIIFLLPITFFGALITYQRGGFISSFIALLYTIFKIRSSMTQKLLILLSLGCLIPLGINIFANLDSSLLLRLRDRYNSYSFYQLIDEERGYKPGLSYFIDFPFGVGLGGTSSAADIEGLATGGQVVDANFMRILGDLGILGLLSFFTVLWLTARSALRKKNGMDLLLIVGLICFVCIGTNILDSYYISHFFWMLLGVIDTRPKKRYYSVDLTTNIPRFIDDSYYSCRR